MNDSTGIQSVCVPVSINANIEALGGCYLLPQSCSLPLRRVVASSGGLMQMGQQLERAKYSETCVQHLKLGPDAVMYQAPPQSMNTCRYWTQDPDFGLDPSNVVNELVAPVGGAETHPSRGAHT